MAIGKSEFKIKSAMKIFTVLQRFIEQMKLLEKDLGPWLGVLKIT